MKELLPDVDDALAGLSRLGLLERLYGKTFLVTGCRGFLGRYVVAMLLRLNERAASEPPCRIFAMDSLVVGDADRTEWRNTPGLTFIQHDVRHDFGHGMHLGRLDFVLHLAGIASPHWYKQYPLETIDVAVAGTRNMLEMAAAHGARFLFTSSSEVYQTAQQVPTPETYVGAIPSMTERSSYDCSKLLGETLAYVYARKHSVNSAVVRIFNSVLGDEWLVAQTADGVHIGSADELALRFGALRDGPVPLVGVSVPAIDPHGGSAEARSASHFIKHGHDKSCLEITTRYGRTIRITADHSVFTRARDGRPQAVRGADIRVGDYVALAKRVEVVSRDLSEVNCVEVLANEYGREGTAVSFDGLRELLSSLRARAVSAHVAMGKSFGSAHGQASKDERNDRTSLALIDQLGIGIPHNARVGVRKAGATSSIPARLPLSDRLLWAIGLFIAEGSYVDDGNDRAIIFSTDLGSVRRVTEILTSELGVHVSLPYNKTGAPTARVSSRAVFALWKHLGLIGGRAETKRIPPWALALPLSRLKFLLDGYRAGDGVLNEKLPGRHVFSTVSNGLKNDLIFVLGRFGIVPCVGRYLSEIKSKYPGKKYPFWCITIPKVDPWDILEWDRGTNQTLQCPKSNDIAWALVKAIRPVEPTEFVYDFSVPGFENFVTGQGVMAHNSFGPGMRQSDQRILPRIASAIKSGQPLEVFVSGHWGGGGGAIPGGRLPKRTYTPVGNTLYGLFLALAGEATLPDALYNLGLDSPEVTVPELCNRIADVTGHRVPIAYSPPPENYQTEPLRRCPDISRLKALGFGPVVPLEVGLQRFFDWSLEVYR